MVSWGIWAEIGTSELSHGFIFHIWVSDWTLPSFSKWHQGMSPFQNQNCSWARFDSVTPVLLGFAVTVEGYLAASLLLGISGIQVGSVGYFLHLFQESKLGSQPPGLLAVWTLCTCSNLWAFALAFSSRSGILFLPDTFIWLPFLIQASFTCYLLSKQYPTENSTSHLPFCYMQGK